MTEQPRQTQPLIQEDDPNFGPFGFSSSIPRTVSIENGIFSKAQSNSSSSRRLVYGSATPGTMATMSPSFASAAAGATGDGNYWNSDRSKNSKSNSSLVSSPLGIFASFALSSSRTLFGDNTSKDSIKDTDETPVLIKAKERQDTVPNPLKSGLDDNNSATTVGSTPTQENQCLGISAPSYSMDYEDDDSVASSDSNRIGIERTNYEIPVGDIPISPMDPFLKRKKRTIQPQNDHNDDAENELWHLKLQQQANGMHKETILEEDDDDDDDDGNQRPDDAIERFIHEPTAQGHYLVNSHPLDAPLQGIQYSLTEGKAAMSPLHRKLSKSKKLESKTRPNITVEQQQQQLRSPPTTPITSTPSPIASFKIFVLLVAPKKKIFEIIQVFYAPLETTVHHLIQCIPPNATEPALASQQYIGMCRLDGQTLGIDMMASAASSSSSTRNFVECAKIIRGEVLVAIPKGYTAQFCSLIAKPILSNPKVTKLLQKSDPLAPSKKKKKKEKKKKSKSSPNSKYKSIEIKAETAMINSPYVRRQPSPSSSTGEMHNDPADRTREKRLIKALSHRSFAAKSHHDDLDYSYASSMTTNNNYFNHDGTALMDMSLDNDDHSSTPDNAYHHLPMELWQTQMSFRSDSSASSVDSSSFISSPTPFVSPTASLRLRKQQQRNFTPSSTPIAIPEAHLESPTLGLDIEVCNPKNNDDEDLLQQDAAVAATNESTMASTQNKDSDDIMAKLSFTLANKDIQGAMQAFGNLLRQNHMITPTASVAAPVATSSSSPPIPSPSSEQDAILAKLIQAVQQHSMER